MTVDLGTPGPQSGTHWARLIPNNFRLGTIRSQFRPDWTPGVPNPSLIGDLWCPYLRSWFPKIPPIGGTRSLGKPRSFQYLRFPQDDCVALSLAALGEHRHPAHSLASGSLARCREQLSFPRMPTTLDRS